MDVAAFEDVLSYTSELYNYAPPPPTLYHEDSTAEARCQSDASKANFTLRFMIFTALHVMQTRYCDENSVRLSVRPSVCHTRVL